MAVRRAESHSGISDVICISDREIFQKVELQHACYGIFRTKTQAECDAVVIIGPEVYVKRGGRVTCKLQLCSGDVAHPLTSFEDFPGHKIEMWLQTDVQSDIIEYGIGEVAAAEAGEPIFSVKPDSRFDIGKYQFIFRFLQNGVGGIGNKSSRSIKSVLQQAQSHSKGYPSLSRQRQVNRVDTVKRCSTGESGIVAFDVDADAVHHSPLIAYGFDALVGVDEDGFWIVFKSDPLCAVTHPGLEAFLQAGIGGIDAEGVEQEIGELRVLLRINRESHYRACHYDEKDSFHGHLIMVTEPVIGFALKSTGFNSMT